MFPRVVSITAVAWLALGINGTSRKRRGSRRFLPSVQHLHRSFPDIWHGAARWVASLAHGTKESVQVSAPDRTNTF